MHKVSHFQREKKAVACASLVATLNMVDDSSSDRWCGHYEEQKKTASFMATHWREGSAFFTSNSEKPDDERNDDNGATQGKNKLKYMRIVCEWVRERDIQHPSHINSVESFENRLRLHNLLQHLFNMHITSFFIDLTFPMASRLNSKVSAEKGV